MIFLGNVIVVALAAWFLPGVSISGIIPAILVTLALSLINSYGKGFIIFLTLPLTIFTLGFFLFFINTVVVLLAALIVPGFYVAGFLSAFLFSLIVSLFGTVLD